MKEPYLPNKEGVQGVKIVDRDSGETSAIMDQLSSVRCCWNGNDETYRPEV